MPGKPRTSHGRARSLCLLHRRVGWVEKLEPCRPSADTWVVLLQGEIVQAVEHKIVGEVVQEEIVSLGYPGLGEAGATRARRGK